MTKRYVVGFMFDDSLERVVLIQKKNPEWQAGRLNGVGGKVEPGEFPRVAMRREFLEEAGVDEDGWEEFVRLDEESGAFVHFYVVRVKNEVFDSVRTMTDEVVRKCYLHPELLATMLSNLNWLIPMAIQVLIGDDRCKRFVVTEGETWL